MIQEDKDLLLKDLCARLPYYPKCEMIDELRVVNNEKEPSYIDVLFPKYIELLSFHNNFTIKPYLRPMSSMTGEEKEELDDLGLAYWDNGKYTDENGNTIIYGGKEIQLLPDIETYDWLNAHHFDYRGLIPMGIALEAPEGMYNIK